MRLQLAYSLTDMSPTESFRIFTFGQEEARCISTFPEAMLSTVSDAGRFTSSLTSSLVLRSTGKLVVKLILSGLSDSSLAAEIESVIGSITGGEIENSTGWQPGQTVAGTYSDALGAILHCQA
ncbi:hypothetical protein H5410_011789 [Solanum commersonii]|uniref:Uncharacterized protein n=1 Tax=Solanum commersonii TaxID=4109 RepID=A0A9J6AQN4_SOLCO|nr:hypothetical protein H5410_011789 [Solanum commersonii]